MLDPSRLTPDCGTGSHPTTLEPFPKEDEEQVQDDVYAVISQGYASVLGKAAAVVGRQGRKVETQENNGGGKGSSDVDLLLRERIFS
ncbi:hypothetical protein Trydic_g10208 [Trypoxylus dichotomus]